MNDPELCTDDNRITDTDAPLDSAISIEEVKEREEEDFGEALEDPSSAAH